ncbi:MAG: nuclear transport factor 2 family protein [Phaeodactylibacter sp.]|uniref:nuclear transport factor 2 family protein n=1 Tax=Phaeodactylibacter sp. TaxID=1940289 RepID=UPI0032EDA54F
MIIHDFYTAFQRKDIAGMQACYAQGARFEDPVFPGLSYEETCQMWAMLVTAGKDLELTFSDVEAQGEHASAKWQATYTFSATGRKIVNPIGATFELRDGKIYRHRDHFNFYRWAQQAFGPTGYLIGWAPFFQKKVQASARRSLEKYMAR